MRRLSGIVLVVAALIVTATAAYEIAHWHKIYPGIQAGTVAVGNLTPAAAEAKIRSAWDKNSHIELVWGTSRWTLLPEQLGLELNASASAYSAYQAGRTNSIHTNLTTKFRSWQKGFNVPLVVSLDENQTTAALAEIVAQIDIPAQEPEIKIDNGQVVVTNGENGQTVDERMLLANIKQAVVATRIEPIQIPVRQLTPKLSESEVNQVRSKAQSQLGRKITLKLESTTWDIPENQIITWMSPIDVAGWKEEEIAKWIAELAQTVNRPAQNALFNYLGSGKVEQFKPAASGIALDETQLLAELVGILNQTDNRTPTIDLPVATTAPSIATDQVNNLGIKELVARGESNYTGSIPNRIFNLKKAAESMNGVLVAPGEDFSFNKYVGDISAAGGYKSAYIIQNGRTVLGDGGGVCQVSTTMFRAALAAGLPITERHAHAYRVSYYENDRQPGFDATIFTPSVDFKFKNDTPGYILIQAILDESKKSLAFEFYGTKDGREVTISKARVWDQASPPPPLYQDDPTLPVGTTKQVDFPAWGAKAAFDWKVTRNGEVLQERTFYSAYRPWQAVYLRGTKV